MGREEPKMLVAFRLQRELVEELDSLRVGTKTRTDVVVLLLQQALARTKGEVT